MKLTTSRGIEVEAFNIQMVLDAFFSAHKDLAPPTYEVKGFGGVSQRLPLTQEIVDGNEATPEEVAAWNEYLVQRAENDRKRNEDHMRLMLLKGFRIPVTITEEWIAEQKACGLPVSDDPIERKLQWIKTEVCPTAEDFQNMMSAFLSVNGAPEELIRQAENTFQRAMGKHSANGHDTAEREMERVDAVRAGDDRVRDGTVDERVRPRKRRG